MKKQTYSVPEAAQLLGCSKNHLYDLIASNEFRGVIRLGSKIVISRKAIDELLTPA